VFYRTNRDGAAQRRLEFTMSLPLQLGENEIRVFARESADALAIRRLIIRRDNPDGSTASAPRHRFDEDTLGDDEE
jgi:hypothetical protein